MCAQIANASDAAIADKFGKIVDRDGVVWHWWASYEKNFFMINESQPLDVLITKVRSLISQGNPLQIHDSPDRVASIAHLCMGINKIMFKSEEKDRMDRYIADSAVNPVPLVFLPADLACLLVELES